MKTASKIRKFVLGAAMVVAGLTVLGYSSDAQAYGYRVIRSGYSSYGLGYGGYTVGYGGVVGYNVPVTRWHDTSHLDYQPASVQWHGNHFDYVPAHYDVHNTGYWGW